MGLSYIIVHQLEKDEGFKEFLSVHQKRDQAPTWANDVLQAAGPEAAEAKTKGKKKKKASDDYLNFDSDDSEEDEENEEDEDEDEDEDEGR